MYAVVCANEPIKVKWSGSGWHLYKMISLYFNIGLLIPLVLSIIHQAISSSKYGLAALIISIIVITMLTVINVMSFIEGETKTSYWIPFTETIVFYPSTILLKPEWQEKLARAIKGQQGAHRKLGFWIKWQIRLALHKERRMHKDPKYAHKHSVPSQKDIRKNDNRELWLDTIIQQNTKATF